MKKRLFLILTLFISFINVFVYAQSIPPVAGMDVIGVVKQNSGAVMPNVVVTDGYTTTLTNAQGIYYLKKNVNATFVYLSTPAGYVAPIDKSIPQFYAKLYPNNKVQRNDFSLNKTGVNENKHMFLAMGDPQPQTEREVIRYQNETIEDMKQLVSANPGIPILVGVAGDICWDAPLIWPYYKRACARLTGIPFYNAPGNHDHDYCYSDQEVSNFPSITHYEKFFGPSYHSHTVGNVHYIYLDDVNYKSNGTDKTYTGAIAQRQLDWLTKDLSYVPKTTLLVITFHIATKRRYTTSYGISNYAAFYAKLAGYKGYFISGHHHVNNIETNIGACPGFMELNLGSTHGDFWDVEKLNNDKPIKMCPDGSPYGYAVITFEGNVAVDWYWKGVGTPRAFQMRLYKKGELYAANTGVAALKDKVGANIFFWDSAWKVDYYEDGVKKGAMTRNTSRISDPEAIFIMRTGNVRYHSSASVVTGNNNDHLFYYTPSAGATRFKVVATDRWGKVYKDSSLIN